LVHWSLVIGKTKNSASITKMDNKQQIRNLNLS
jgi:hypothetical protein